MNVSSKIDLKTERVPGLMAGPSEGFQANFLYGLDELCKSFVDKDMNILEIGSLHGVSTSLLCYYANHVDAVDINILPGLEKIATLADNLMIFNQNSINFLQDAKKQGKTYDLVYLDGDHSYAGVKRDIQLACEIINNGGYIAGHDLVEGNMRKNNGVLKAVYDSFPGIITGDTILYRFSDSSWLIKVS